MSAMVSVLRLGLSTLFMIASVTAAAACSCRSRSPADIAASSQAIFTGVALRSEAAGPGQSLTTFRVIEGIKGAQTGREIRVRHRSGSSASCGVVFAIGQDHALAAYSDNGALAANLCSVYPFRGREGLALMQTLRRLP